MATQGPTKPYREVFEKELKQKGWDQILYQDEDEAPDKRDRIPNRIDAVLRSTISVFDISHDGAIEEHTIRVSEDKTERDRLLSDGKDVLSRIPDDLATRVIVIGDRFQKFIRDSIGVHYHISPAFFRAITYYSAIRATDGRRDPDTSAWPAYDIHLPAYITDVDEGFLHLGKGCLTYITEDPTQKKVRIVINAFTTSFFSANMVTSLQRSKTFASYNWQRLSEIYDKDLRRSGIKFDTSELFGPALKSMTSAEVVAINDNALLLCIPVLEVFLHLITSILATRRDHLLRYQYRLGGTPTEDLAKQIHRTWIILGEMAFEWGDTRKAFLQYDEAHNGGRAQTSPRCERLLEQHDLALKEASRCEAYAREMLAVYVGNFALEDSKASIRQAKLALDDTQRSRLITILAYVFVPISVGTSIFGMNINELNGTGQSIWVYIVTTFILAWLAAFVWAASFQWHIYYNASDLGRIGEFDQSGKHKVSGSYRLHLFRQLLKSRHVLWAWNSGVIFSLLTSGRISYIPTCRGCVADTATVPEALAKKVGTVKPHNMHSPCSYIALHLAGDRGAFKVSGREIPATRKGHYVSSDGRFTYTDV